MNYRTIIGRKLFLYLVKLIESTINHKQEKYKRAIFSILSYTFSKLKLNTFLKSLN